VATSEPAEAVIEEATTAHGGSHGKGDEYDELDPVQGMQMQSDHLLP
jgi:hypothetical protein